MAYLRHFFWLHSCSSANIPTHVPSPLSPFGWRHFLYLCRCPPSHDWLQSDQFDHFAHDGQTGSGHGWTSVRMAWSSSQISDSKKSFWILFLRCSSSWIIEFERQCCTLYFLLIISTPTIKVLPVCFRNVSGILLDTRHRALWPVAPFCPWMTQWIITFSFF